MINTAQLDATPATHAEFDETANNVAEENAVQSGADKVTVPVVNANGKITEAADVKTQEQALYSLNNGKPVTIQTASSTLTIASDGNGGYVVREDYGDNILPSEFTTDKSGLEDTLESLNWKSVASGIEKIAVPVKRDAEGQAIIQPTNSDQSQNSAEQIDEALIRDYVIPEQEMKLIQTVLDYSGRALKLVNELEKRALGKAEGNTIFLSQNELARAQADGENGIAMLVFKHELTHTIKGAKTWESYKSLALREMNKAVSAHHGATLDEYRQYIKEQYANRGVNLDEDGVDEEIVANYTQNYLFNSEEAINNLVNTDRTLAQRIWRFLKNAVRSLTGQLTAEQRTMQRAERLFAQALSKSKSAKGLQGKAEGTNKKAASNGGVRYSIKTDKFGKKYWQVESEKDIFNGIKTLNGLKQAAFDWLLNGEKGDAVNHIIDGQELRFIRIGAKKYAYGSTPKVDKAKYQTNQNRATALKMRLAPSVLDLIENSNTQYKTRDEHSHTFAREGFKNYKGRVRIDDVFFDYNVLVGKNESQNTFYDINLEVSDEVPRVNNASLLLSAASNTHYAQEAKKVKHEGKYSVSPAQDTAYLYEFKDDGFSAWLENKRASEPLPIPQYNAERATPTLVPIYKAPQTTETQQKPLPVPQNNAARIKPTPIKPNYAGMDAQQLLKETDRLEKQMDDAEALFNDGVITPAEYNTITMQLLEELKEAAWAYQRKKSTPVKINAENPLTLAEYNELLKVDGEDGAEMAAIIERDYTAKDMSAVLSENDARWFIQEMQR